MNKDKNTLCQQKKITFTLAEVLIVIGVIGVVATITIPTLISLIKDKVNENRKEVIEDRLIQGLNQLNTLDDGMNAFQYQNTEQFIQALSKYYKMSQICNATELDKCFPYKKINYVVKNRRGGLTLENLDTPEAFKLKSEEYYNPAGFISAQGTPFIMMLKKDCIMDTGESMRSIPTSCIQYIYDNNAADIPNELGLDIQYSSNIKFPMPPDGILDSPIDNYKSYLILGDVITNGLNTCKGSEYEYLDNNWTTQSNLCPNNKWAAAKKTCSDLGYDLPTKEQLQELYNRKKNDKKLTSELYKKSSENRCFFSSSTGNEHGTFYRVCLGNGTIYPLYVSNSQSLLCLGK